MFDLRSARYFVAVAEELHFGRAAQRLQMSQPPLSQAIRQLERDVGAQLLARTNRRVALTAAGEAFLPECRELLQRAETAARVPRSAASGLSSAVTIGAVASAFTWPLPTVLDALRAQAPELAIRIMEIDTHEAIERLRSGQIDLGLVRLSSPRPGLTTTTLFHDEFVALLPGAHPMASSRGRLKLADLAEDAWIWLEREVSPDYHDDMSAACRASGFSPRAAHMARSIASQIALVQCGVGVTIIPRAMAADLPSTVVARDLHNRPDAVTLAVTIRSTARYAERFVHGLVVEKAGATPTLARTGPRRRREGEGSS